MEGEDDYSRHGGGGGGGVFGMFGQAAQHLQQRSTSMSQQPAAFDWDEAAAASTSSSAASTASYASRALDLVFILDCTGSMQSYLTSATEHIHTICDHIVNSEQLSAPGALRIGLIGFRDAPPQDYSYITKRFDFTSDVDVIKGHLSKLYASGGGDGPEAMTPALKDAIEMDWREHATRLAVLITDAPPHGIGEYGDGFPDGDPIGKDPLVLARQMAQMGISLFMVACEPALASYSNAADFYQGLVRITSGLLVPLTTASLLSHAIIAAASEAMTLDRLHREVGDEVAERLRSLSLEAASRSSVDTTASALMDEVARDLHQRLLLRNESTKQLVVESIYRDSEESRQNIEIWSTAPDLKTARPHIQKVRGSRLSDKFLSSRRADAKLTNRSGRSGVPGSPPSSSSSTWGSSSASSPGSRKVVSDFSSFSAGGKLSVSQPGATSFGASPDSPSRNSAAFGGARVNRQPNSMMDDDDDDDDDIGAADDEEDSFSKRAAKLKYLPTAVQTDEGALEVSGDDGSRLRFRQGAISLDQARRLAMQSAYRGGLA